MVSMREVDGGEEPPEQIVVSRPLVDTARSDGADPAAYSVDYAHVSHVCAL